MIQPFPVVSVSTGASFHQACVRLWISVPFRVNLESALIVGDEGTVRFLTADQLDP